MTWMRRAGLEKNAFAGKYRQARIERFQARHNVAAKLAAKKKRKAARKARKR